MERSVEEKYDTIKSMEKKIELLLGARLRHRDKIMAALKKLDELRRKLTSQVGDFKGVAEIRKWREAGCMS